MKSVLISIQPEWCELIASSKKTIEVRKTRPELQTPFKCYIYCTKGRDMLWVTDEHHRDIGIACLANAKAVGGANKANGKVIGEFVCDKIEEWNTTWLYGDDVLQKETCLDDTEIMDYMNNYTDRIFYLWHISDLKIYDKPKELGELYTICRHKECNSCKYKSFDYGYGGSKDLVCTVSGKIPLTCPPQSYCYVEEL